MMKKIAFLMITFSFLTGSLVAVMDKAGVNWYYFIPLLLIGMVGAALVHRHEWQNTRSQKQLTTNLMDIKTSLTRVIDNLAKLNAEKQAIEPCDIHLQIDRLFRDDLAIFAQARESIAHAYNLQVYADVMSHFASGERYLNRVWSASVDGYIDEVNTYLDRAQSQFNEAFGIISQLKESN